MIKSVIALVATSALAVTLCQYLGAPSGRRARRERRQHHDEVSRWEAEGGNLPDVKPVTPANVTRAPRPR